MKKITKDISNNLERLTETKFMKMLDYHWREGETVTELTVNQDQMDDLKAWLNAPWHIELEKLTYHAPYGDVEIKLSH